MSCACRLKSGPRTGQRCNAKVAQGHRFCGRHAGCAAAARPVKGGVKPVKPQVKRTYYTLGRNNLFKVQETLFGHLDKKS